MTYLRAVVCAPILVVVAGINAHAAIKAYPVLSLGPWVAAMMAGMSVSLIVLAGMLIRGVVELDGRGYWD